MMSVWFCLFLLCVSFLQLGFTMLFGFALCLFFKSLVLVFRSSNIPPGVVLLFFLFVYQNLGLKNQKTAASPGALRKETLSYDYRVKADLPRVPWAFRQ